MTIGGAPNLDIDDSFGRCLFGTIHFFIKDFLTVSSQIILKLVAWVTIYTDLFVCLYMLMPLKVTFTIELLLNFDFDLDGHYL